MKAIVLAAGVGKRLGASARGLPKCLLRVGEEPLLGRTLRSICRQGIRDIVLVVGYEKESIRAYLNKNFGDSPQIRLRENPDYRRGSILSLWSVRDELNDDLLLMDADVLFPDALLRRLMESSHCNAFLLDPRAAGTGEEMMLMVKGGRVARITRKITPDYDLIGEGVGFMKLSGRDAPLLREAVERLVRRGRMDCDYEEAIDLFLQGATAGFEPVGDLAWTEIDFPEDIERAEREVLPVL